MKSTKPGKNPSAATPVAEAERLYCVLVKCNPTDAAPVVQSPLVEALGRNHATLNSLRQVLVSTDAPTKRAVLSMISPKPSFDGWFFGITRNRNYRAGQG